MKVAVTGGSGQLGSLVLRRLISERQIKHVRSLDLRPPPFVTGKLTALEGDIRSADLEPLLEGCEVLVHLAFQLFPPRPGPAMREINVDGSRRVLEAALRAGCRQLVVASSAAAYGLRDGHPDRLIESSPRLPQAEPAYVAHKQALEDLLDRLEAEHPAVAMVRLRPGLCLGRHMEHPMTGALRRRLLPVARVGGQSASPLLQPLVWDEDVADAALLAIRTGARGAFNLAAEPTASLEELARAGGLRLWRLPPGVLRAGARLGTALARLGVSGAAVDPAWLEASAATVRVSSERARSELGWRPRCATDVQVLERFDAEVPAGPDPRLAAFMALAALGARLQPASVEMAGIRGRVHLAFSGRRGGDFGVLISDGRARITREPPRPASSVVRLTTALFLEMLAGRTDFSRAQLTGRIRTEGEPLGNTVLSGLVSSFRAQLTAPGRDGAVARVLERWVERSLPEKGTAAR